MTLFHSKTSVGKNIAPSLRWRRFLHWDLLKYFIREEKIVGLEISDFKVRVVFLSRDKKNKKQLKIEAFGEEELEEGIIKDGKLQNRDGLAAILKKLWRKIGIDKIKIYSVILSLPSRNFFTQIFQFPRHLSSEEIDEAMKLNIEFSVPLPPDKIYVDWQNVSLPDSPKQEIFLTVTLKEIIDSYLSTLSSVGIAATAVETHLLSIGRIIDVKVTSLVLILSLEGVSSFVLDRGIIRFDRFLSWSSHYIFKEYKQQKDKPMELFQKILKDEVFRLLNYYHSEIEDENAVEKILLIGPLDFLNQNKQMIESQFKIKTEIADFPSDFPSLPILDDNSALIACGASLRGLINRKDDAIVSLMPIGTEEAYERQKKFSFIEFLSNFTVFLSIFFLGVLSVFYFLMFLIEKNSSKMIQMVKPSQNIMVLQEKAKEFNEMVDKITFIDGQIPYFSDVILDLKNLIVPGVIVKQIIIGNPQEVINISGTARTRDNLLQFRMVLKKSGRFMSVIIPLVNLERKTNISFSMTLRLKNPEKLYGIK